MPTKSTRQLLKKIPGFPCLYRHSVNDGYYGIAKIGGKRKEHSLGTTDRKLAERKMKAWLEDFAIKDATKAHTTMGQLLGLYERNMAGKKPKTRATRASILKQFRMTWTPGVDIRVDRVKTSDVTDWLAQHEGRLKNASYNEYARFIRTLLAIAVKDHIIVRSPFEGVETKWKKPEKPVRLTPTPAQFESIVAEIRHQKHNPDAEASADFVEFLGLAGVGQKEAGSMLWSDINEAPGRISFRRHKTGVLFYVPIYPQLEPFLKRIQAKRPEQKDGAVFQIKDAKKALAAACRRLECPAFSQRAIRRVLIRKLWKAGIDKKMIAKWQGHSDGGKLILDTYTEAFSDDDDAHELAELNKIGAAVPVPVAQPAAA